MNVALINDRAVGVTSVEFNHRSFGDGHRHAGVVKVGVFICVESYESDHIVDHDTFATAAPYLRTADKLMINVIVGSSMKKSVEYRMPFVKFRGRIQECWIFGILAIDPLNEIGVNKRFASSSFVRSGRISPSEGGIRSIDNHAMVSLHLVDIEHGYFNRCGENGRNCSRIGKEKSNDGELH